MTFAIMSAFAFNTSSEKSGYITGVYRTGPDATVCDKETLCTTSGEFFCEVGTEQAYEEYTCLTPLYRIDGF